MAQEDVFKKIVSHCKEYGFVFPSSEIYDGLGAVYDYGQNGVELKNNIKEYWWKSMVLLHENIVGIDSAIFMHPTIWKASGHVDAFNDPLIDNRDSKKRYRADVLIEDQIAKYDEKIQKEVEKARKRFGDSFDEQKYMETSERVKETKEKRDALHARYAAAMQGPDLEELKQIILDEEIVCPISGTRNWTDVRQFNLMFSTEMGASADGSMKVYLRPETAQGIFVNYLNVQKTGRMKIPFGIAQIGKAFRNEIVARQFIFRMREFEQMEMQFFVAPAQSWSGSPSGSRLVWLGIRRWASVLRTTVSTITTSWLTMPMLLLTLSLRCHSVSRRWRVFTHVPTSTCRSMRNTLARASNTSTHRPTRAIRRLSSRRQSVSTVCSSLSCVTLSARRNWRTGRLALS